MQTMLFILSEPYPGSYLLGTYAASSNRVLTAATLVCDPAAQTMSLALELNGALTAHTFVIGPSATETRLALTLNQAVAAGQTVRWKVTDFEGDDPGEAPSRLALVLTHVPQASFTSPPQTLTVRWHHRSLDVKVFDYAAGVFTPTAFATGRAEILRVGDLLTLSVSGETALTDDGAELRVGNLVSGAALPISQPHLRFCANSEILAELNAAAFRVPATTEATGGDGVFNFGAARLGAEGLCAPQYQNL